MTTNAFIHHAHQGEHVRVVSDEVRILLDSKSTGNACMVFEETTHPGNGTPLHRHAKDDEWFYVIEGTAKFVVDGVETVVGPGGFVFAPKGSVHAFVNIGTTATRMVIGTYPGGLDGPFRAADRLGREGRANAETLGAAFAPHGVEFVGPVPSV
jgi:quercetin dioxygenase-like cupin family protein